MTRFADLFLLPVGLTELPITRQHRIRDDASEGWTPVAREKAATGARKARGKAVEGAGGAGGRAKHGR